jgi:predicted cobalt transporter CbtA
MEDLREIWLFLKERKKWWLTPIIVTIILLALLVFAGSTSTVAPFVYTLF